MKVPGRKQGDAETKEDKIAEIRRDYVTATFITTAVSHSAVVDLFTVFGCSVNVMRDTFVIYGGRASIRDMFRLFESVIHSSAIGASEIAEIGAEELVEGLGKAVEKIPFINIAAEMFADGFVNALLVCRVAVMADIYCNRAVVPTRTKWYPELKSLKITTKDITGGVGKLAKELASEGGSRLHNWCSDLFHKSFIRKKAHVSIT